MYYTRGMPKMKRMILWSNVQEILRARAQYFSSRADKLLQRHLRSNDRVDISGLYRLRIESRRRLTRACRRLGRWMRQYDQNIFRLSLRQIRQTKKVYSFRLHTLDTDP